ncbi:1-phosphofructokinase family hexose kinase [Lacticaseibacillus parakribbianus]|uniref:1-phosphofructokinase family hexose kinase n=1 Tax=Lacticaseibacillus parakribbianus TaxID=2970927 RepID=UPI0021CB25BF|nr:hexose kinase [Lacticaseibacillus parakribbianus]
MILTVTLNPAVDVQYRMATLHLDNVNRVGNGTVSAGGNGINAARVLTQLAAPTLALGLAGGVRGRQLGRLMQRDGIPNAFTPIAGETRECVALLHGTAQTEILPAGPRVTAAELRAFTTTFTARLATATAVILAGNLPPDVAPTVLSDLIALAQQAAVPVFLDVPGPELDAVLAGPARPFLVKPNQQELADLLKQPVATTAAALSAQLAAPALAAVPWVLVSLGRNGAIARHGAKRYRVTVPTIAAVNAVGSGDATTAGITWAITQGMSDAAALAWATACGTVNAGQVATGSVDSAAVAALAEDITVTAI